MRHIALFVRLVDRLNDVIGRGVSWLTLLTVVVAFIVVIMRYVFSVGWVWMQEFYLWLHAIVFMTAAAYTLLHDGHVRVDIFYRPASPRFKAWVDLFGCVFLLLPVIVVIAVSSESYIIDSWVKLESSRQAGGLPALFLMKSLIWLFCLLVGLQAMSMAGRSLLFLGNSKYSDI